MENLLTQDKNSQARNQINDISFSMGEGQLSNRLEFGHENQQKMNEQTISKSKPKVNELGTLGTLKNLARILSQQESNLNGTKSVKQLKLELKGASEPTLQPQQVSLSSHQLHMKQKQLVQQVVISSENNAMIANSGKLHRPTNSSQTNLLNFKNKQGKQIENILDRSTLCLQKGLNNTMNGPMMQGALSQSLNNKKGDRIDRLIRNNLKKQKEKEDKMQYDLEVKQERERKRKAELALQNHQVRQANRIKQEKQERRAKSKPHESGIPGKFERQQKTTGIQNDLSQSVEIQAYPPGGHSGKAELRKGGQGSGLRSQNQRENYLIALDAGNTRRFAPAQRSSQERGQRVLSGASKGSRAGGSSKSGGSRVLSGHAKSGRSGGQGLGSAQLFVQDQRGHIFGNQASAHAGGKKDSINSNISNMNMQQSQQVMSNLQHGEIGLQTSQRLDTSLLRGVLQSLDNTQNDEIQEHLSQEDSVHQSDAQESGEYDEHAREYRDIQSNQQNYNRITIQDKETRPEKSDRRLNNRSSLHSLEAAVHQVPMSKPKKIGKILRADHQHQDLNDLTLNKYAMSSTYLRSQKQLTKSNVYDISALGIQSQTFSLKPIPKGSGMSSQVKNRKRTQVNIGSQSTVGGLGLIGMNTQNKPVVHQTLTTHNNGLDFLDIKKEIKDELRQVDKKLMGLGPKRRAQKQTKVQDSTLVILNDQSIQDLRADPSIQVLSSKLAKQGEKNANKSFSPIEYRGKDQNQQIHSHAALPGMVQTGTRHRNNNNKKMQLTSQGAGTSNNLNLQHLFLNESSSVQQLGQSQIDDHPSNINQVNQTSNQRSKKQQKAIQKFIKAKKLEREQQIEQSKRDELSKLIKTQKNLSKLDFFVKKKFQNSGATHQNNLSSHSFLDPQQCKINTKAGKRSQIHLQIASRNKKGSDNLDEEIEQILMLKDGEQGHLLNNMIQESRREQEFGGTGTSMIKGRSTTAKSIAKQLSVNQQSSQEYNDNFDNKLSKMLKDLRKERVREPSNDSFSLRDARDGAVAGSFQGYHRDHSPLSQQKLQNANLRQSQKTMKSISDIVERSKSNQRASRPHLYHATSPMMANNLKIHPSSTQQAVAKTNKLKTIDQRPANEIEIFKKFRDKSQKHFKAKRRSDSQRNKKGSRQAHSINQIRQMNAKRLSRSNKSRSKSKSNKSRNQRMHSKKSQSRSRDNKKSKSLRKTSNSKSGGSKKSKSSKSRSISHSRSNQADLNYSRIQSSIQQLARNAAKLNAKLTQKIKKQRNSLSPRFDRRVTNNGSFINVKITRNMKGDQMHSDFDYNKFMHGTIKIPPSSGTRGEIVTKPSKTAMKGAPSRSSVGPRRRNRSQARLQSNAAQNCPLRTRVSNILEKPKSQQNILSADRLVIERSNSNLKLRQQSRNKTQLTINTKEGQKFSAKQQKRLKVDSSQIKEILKKINIDSMKKKVKKRTAKQQKSQKINPEQRVHIAANSSCININANAAANILSPVNDLSNSSLLAAQRMLSPIPNNKMTKISIDPNAQQNHLQDSSTGKQKHSSKQPEIFSPKNKKILVSTQKPMSSIERQRQLKELLKNIYKKNEQLIKKQIQKGHQQTVQNQVTVNKSTRQSQSSLESSANKQSQIRSKYSEEKWVEVQDRSNLLQNLALRQGERPKTGSFNVQGMTSQRFSEPSNNFTFFERTVQQTSSKQGGDIATSYNKSVRSNSTLEQRDDDAKRLEKLYLNNLEMNGGTDYNSLNLQIKNLQGTNQSSKITEEMQEEMQTEINQNENEEENKRLIEQNNMRLHINTIQGSINQVIEVPSSRSIRSVRSGIMAQIQEQASSGRLRVDHELFYQKMLDNHQIPKDQPDAEDYLTKSSQIPGNSTSSMKTTPDYDQQYIQNQNYMQEQIIDSNIGQSNEQSPESNLYINRDGSSELKQFVFDNQKQSESSQYYESLQDQNHLSSRKEIRENLGIEFEEELREDNFYGQISDIQSQENISKSFQQRQAIPASKSKPMQQKVQQKNIEILDEMGSRQITEDEDVYHQSSVASKNEQSKLHTMESHSIPQSLMSLQTHNRKSSGEDEDQHEEAEEALESEQSRNHDSRPEEDQNFGLELQTIHKTETEADNGPTTLISHLNDPNHEVITYNEEDESRDVIGQKGLFANQSQTLNDDETVNRRVSPLENTMNPTTENLTLRDGSGSSSGKDALKQAQVEPNPATAESLLKYLEIKWNEKRQEAGSQFENSRASASGSETKIGRSNVTSAAGVLASSAEKQQVLLKNKEQSIILEQKLPKDSQLNLEIDQSSERSGIGEIDHEQIILALDQRMQQDLSALQNIEEPSPSKAQETQVFRDLALNPALDNQEGILPIDVQKMHNELPLKSPGSETPLQSDRKSTNELDKYLDDDISQKNPIAQVQPLQIQKEDMIIKDQDDPEQLSNDQREQVVQLNQAAEMIITSNLTTLNMDGDNSSGEGERILITTGSEDENPGAPDLDDEEIQQLKDKKYLDQFRKRQNRLNSRQNEQQIGLDQIEIEIQENSDPVSPQVPPILVALSTKSVKKEEDELQSQEVIQNIEINESKQICEEILIELLDSIFDQKQPTVEEYHESLLDFSTITKQEEAKPKEISKTLTPKDVYNYISNSVNQPELRHQIKQILEMKQRTNLENELIQTDDYVYEILQFLMQFELITHHQLTGRSDDAEVIAALEELGGINYLVIFLKNLTTPIKRSLVDLLKQYKDQAAGRYDHFESVADPLKHPILPIDIYLDVEKQREYEFQIAQRQDKVKAQQLSTNVKNYLSGHSASSVNTVSIIQESQHILNKSIFDAMNESLTKFRPYGVVGEPLPWSNKFRRLQTDVDINSVDTERLVQMVKQEIFRWMSISQGSLLHTQELIFQFIDLHIPIMPDLQQKIDNFEKIKEDEKKNEDLEVGIEGLEEEKQHETKENNQKDDQLKLSMPDSSPTMIPKALIDKNSKDNKDSQQNKDIEESKPILLKNFETKDKLVDIQNTAFNKFKKTLVEEVTQEVRQAKLAAQLQHEILEDEHWWLNYEFEETQIRIDLSEFIFDKLITETAEFINMKQTAQSADEYQRQ